LPQRRDVDTRGRRRRPGHRPVDRGQCRELHARSCRRLLMGTRLYRSRRDRMLAGVAGGLAEIWGADPTLVRLIWALLVILTGGAALLVYIVMAIVVPDENAVYGAAGAPVGEQAARPPRMGGVAPTVLIGGFLIVLGGFFLIREIFPHLDFDWIWPLALV